jgi:hypothetical protein
MSDFSQGEGWWQASDGKWYPPETAPPGFAAPTAPGSTPPTGPIAPVAPTAPFPVAPTGPAPMGPAPTPTPTPTKSGLGTGPIVAIAVAAIVIIGAIVFFATSGGGDKKNVAATQSSSPRSSSSSKSSSSATSSSSSSSGAPKVVAPTGFKVFSNATDGFALALPESYDVVDPSTGNINDLIDQLAANNPQIANMADQIKSIFSSGGKLVAIDPVSSNGFSDNVNLLEAPGGGDLTSSAAQDQLRQQLETFASNIAFATKQVHGRTILTVSYEGALNGPDGAPVSFFGRQAYVPAAGQLWVLTVSTGSDDGGALFDKISASFDVND